MKRTTLRWVSIVMLLSVLSLVLSACSTLKPPSPTEIMQKSVENTAGQKSFKYKLTLSINAAGQALEMKGDGMAEPPDKSYARMDVLGQTVESLQLSKTEFYIRNAGASEWQAVTEEQMTQSGLNTDVISQQNMFLEFSKDPQLAKDEQVNGVDSYHITFALDLPAMLDKMLTAEVRAMVDPTDGTATGEIWVSKSDLLLQKVNINMKYKIQGQAVESTTLMEYSDFGLPVEMPTP